MKHLGDDVKQQLQRFCPAAGMPELVELWPEAVGETIARNAWPARIARDGTVHVNTADSVWAFELTTRAPEIADRLGVQQVRFAPGRLPEAPGGAAEEVEKPPRAPSAKGQREGERLAAAIEDENLRKIVARAAALSLENGSDSRSV
jgi:hypothetical protein